MAQIAKYCTLNSTKQILCSEAYLNGHTEGLKLHTQRLEPHKLSTLWQI